MLLWHTFCNVQINVCNFFVDVSSLILYVDNFFLANFSKKNFIFCVSTQYAVISIFFLLTLLFTLRPRYVLENFANFLKFEPVFVIIFVFLMCWLKKVDMMTKRNQQPSGYIFSEMDRLIEYEIDKKSSK